MLQLLLFLLHMIDVVLPVAMAVFYFRGQFTFRRPAFFYSLFCLGGILCIAAINPARIKAHSSLTTRSFRLLNAWQRDIRLLIFILVFLLAAYIFVHGSFAKKLYHTLQFTFSYIICEYGFALTVERVKSRYDVNSTAGAAFSLMQYLIFSVIVLALFMIQLRFFLEPSKDMTDLQYVLMSPMLLILLVLIMMSIRMNSYVYNMTFFILSLVMNLCILGLYRNLKRTSDRIATGKLMLKETRFYQEQLKGQRELRRLRHDMKNMLLSLRADLELGQYDEACRKIDAIADDISATNSVITGVVFLDAVLAPKFARIKEEGILLKSHFLLEQSGDEMAELKDYALDLSAILGNLLDNAIEGVLRLPKEEQDLRLIEISITRSKQVLTILIANGSSEVEISGSGPQPSAKVAGRKGIGMESVRERCASLGGYCHFQWQEGMFEVMVQIPV